MEADGASCQVPTLKVGKIKVSVDRQTGALWMRQVEPVFLRTLVATPIADILGIAPADVDERLPVQEET